MAEGTLGISSYNSKKEILKRVFKAVLWVSGLGILLILIFTGLIFYYQDEIKKSGIEKLNQYLKTDVIIKPEDIDVTFLKTFPDASLRFRNAIILDTYKRSKRDTIINVGELRMHFSIMDLFSGKYTIKKISLGESKLNLKLDSKGNPNFIFWKSDSIEGTKAQGKGFDFLIRKLSFKKVNFIFCDSSSSSIYKAEIDELFLSGNFTGSIKEIQSEGNIKLIEIRRNSKKILSNKNLDFTGEFKFNKENLKFKNLALNLEKTNLKLNGEFLKEKDEFKSNLIFEIKGIEYQDIKELIDDSLKQKLDDFEVEGNVSANGTINGILNNYEKLNIKTNLFSEDVAFIYKPRKAKFEIEELQVSFLKTENKKEILNIKKIVLNHKESRLDGKLLIRNFENPELKFSGTINAKAEDLIELYPIDTISSVSGGIKLKTDIEGNLESIKKNFFDSKINLVGEFFDLKMKFKKSITEAGVKSGKIVLDEKLLTAENIKINLKDQELNLSGKAENYTGIFGRSNEPLKINADIQSDFLSYNQLAGLFNNNEGKTKKENVKIISEDVEVIIDLKIKKLKLFNHDLESLTGRLQTRESKVLLENVEFESCGGRVKINSIIEETKDKLRIKGITQIRDINIYEAFKEYKGFGQSTLTHENIKGIANTSVEFSFETDQSFNLITKSLMSSCDITIEKGELIRFKPLEGLGRYIEINELKHVKFSKLKSHVDIMDEKFIIEKTQIDNSAINISLSGSHSFRQDIEYKISLLLSEFLAKKPRKKKELDEELKYVEEDSENKRKVFLLVYGNIDDIKFKYDRKSAKEKVKEDFKNEKQNLKQILNEEFGFFKNDTIKIKKKKERAIEDESLQFEWDNKKQKNNDDDDKDF